MTSAAEHRRYRAERTAGHDRLLRHWLHEDLRNDGENRLGIEFKHDRRFRDTGNLYIETAEKAYPRPGPYAPAGICRNDNTWLWAQGDERGVAVFLKRDLIRVAEGPWRHVETETSRGWLLPMAFVPLFALCVVEAPVPAIDLEGLFA